MENTVAFYSPSKAEKNTFLCKTYTWMGAALLVSAAVAYFGAASGLILHILKATGGIAMILLCIAELVVVFYLSASIRKISSQSAKLLFFAYAALNGLTLSTIFYAFSIASIGLCFISAAAMFFVMALYGAATKSDLTTAGKYLSMALLGVLIASLLNGLLRLFGVGGSMLDWLISVASVVIFTGLSAYDSQKILRASYRADGSEAYSKIAVLGALELYLDFINIFLSLLRLFGDRK